MNHTLKFFVVTAVVSHSLFAIGKPVTGGLHFPERAVAKATLEQIEGDGRYPRPTEITVNKRTGQKAAASFKLVEDTGVRCITTPCPSEQTSLFHVTDTKTTEDGSVYYKATNQPVMIMGIIAPRPGFKVRTIQVADHTNNVRARHKFQLVLTLQGKVEMNTFGGNLEKIGN